MYAVILILLGVSGVYSDSHSLSYYSIGVSSPGSGLPGFSMIGYVDDQQIDLYSSDIRRCVPVAPWLKNKIPEHWEINTQIGKEDEALFRHGVKILMTRFNHTEGFHYIQVICSCDLREDGSITGYLHYRYDGVEHMYLDIQTAEFIPTMAEAQITTQTWNRPDVRRGQRLKYYLENTCIKNLKRFIEYGREDLERRVRPGVKVTGRESGEVTKLHCQVYGFHPRAVDVKWMKNGIDEVRSYESTRVLPNPDGTYQIRVTAEVIPKEDDSYSCYVDHSSLEKPLLVKWELKQDLPLSVIISVVVIIVLTSVITGAIIYRKKNYRAAISSDRTSNSNNSPPKYEDERC
ncbi:class I histocompatibility antigen, F10 alpha chain-like isoform X1 [Rhinoderma darwinii]|uniref:class I histocompatibility antigen, F10 alpha chain-like isoform X1 n=1 Tax=Rhinoderma darwinii TaxID=43563 RepID=UPI003F6674B2